MAMLTDPLQGAAYLSRGMRLMWRPGVRRYALAPLAINVVLFTALIVFGAQQFERLLDWLLGFLPVWLDWLRYLLWPLFVATVLLVVFFMFALLANLLAAPFNGLLSEAVEAALTGQPPPSGGWRQLVGDILPSVWNEVRKILYFARWALPVAVLFLIPGINLAATVLWAVLGAWMLALEYGDYPMGNRRIRFAQQRARWRRHRSLALGFGGATLLATATPLLNLLVVPAAVAGATALWVERMQSSD